MEIVAPEKQGKAGNRNPDGTFMKGVSGNPAGRPKFSVVSILREYLENVPEGEKRNRAMILVEAVYAKAVAENDTAMMRDIIDRIDGKPKQDIGITPASISDAIRAQEATTPAQ